jgi:putative transcriptional regulator
MKKREELTPAGAEIVEALTEFYEALKGGPEAVTKRFTVRTVELDLKPRSYTGEEVKKVRDLLGLSQPLFARFLGVSVKAVRAWENGGKKPSDMACRFLDEIALKPDYWRERVRQVITAKGRGLGGSRDAERAAR